jgi:hypothetical protein
MMSKLRTATVARLCAYVLVAGTCVYSIHGVQQEQKRDCQSEQRLRDDMVFVLTGAGQNERAQLAILNRVGTPKERALLAATFEPGLATALQRIGRDLKC